jgi:hypothetical protein
MPDLNLSDEQKDNINKIYDWSNTLGIDPKFALSVAYPESGAQHIPANDPESTAFGPFQVNKATATANGVDYNKMKENRDLAVWTGLKNLQRHAENPALQGDPSRILAAHRFGENTPYAKSGDPADITPQLADFFTKVGSVYGEDMPTSIYKKPADSGIEEKHSAESATPATSATPNSDLTTRLIGGTGALAGGIGLGSLAANTVMPLANNVMNFANSVSQMRAANALAKLGDKGIPTSANTASVNTPAENATVTEPLKGSDAWLAGRRNENQAMPAAIANQVSTLKGQGPGSASYAEAQNAARIQRLLEMGHDPLNLEHSPSGIITGGQGLSARARQETAAPIAQQAVQANAPLGAQVGQGQGTLKNPTPKTPSPSYLDYARSAMGNASTALEPAANFLRNPITRVGSATFGAGAMLPEILEHLRTSPNKTEDIATDVAKGAALGAAPTLLPNIIQAGLRRVGPLAAAFNNEYDAWNRRNSDPTGAAISGVGGLAALAPFALAGPAGLGLGAAGMLAPPVINYLRDTYGKKKP